MITNRRDASHGNSDLRARSRFEHALKILWFHPNASQKKKKQALKIKTHTHTDTIVVQDSYDSIYTLINGHTDEFSRRSFGRTRGRITSSTTPSRNPVTERIHCTMTSSNIITFASAAVLVLIFVLMFNGLLRAYFERWGTTAAFKIRWRLRHIIRIVHIQSIEMNSLRGQGSLKAR